MGRLKRHSTVLSDAADMIAGLKAINPNFSFNDISIGSFEQDAQTFSAALEEYNLLLSKADDKAREVEEREVGLEKLMTRIVAAVVATYGKNSPEYEKIKKKTKNVKSAAKKI